LNPAQTKFTLSLFILEEKHIPVSDDMKREITAAVVLFLVESLLGENNTL
jgi:hypothetical protein